MNDTPNIINCPACGKEMTEIFIERAQCHVDICLDGCGGIYFDNREFKKIDEQLESIDEIKSALEGKTFEKVDETFKRICPVCGMKMVKNSTSIKGSVIIDDCYNCGGKFLDFGELDKIRAEYPTEEARSKAVVEYLKNNMGSEFEEMHAHKLIANKKEQKQGFLKSFINKFF